RIGTGGGACGGVRALPHAPRESNRTSVFDRRVGDGGNGLRPLADPRDIEDDQTEVRTGGCSDDRRNGRHEPGCRVEPEQRADECAAENCPEPYELVCRARVTLQPTAVDGECHGQTDRDDCECLVVDGDGRQGCQAAKYAQASAAQCYNDAVDRPDRCAALAFYAGLNTYPNGHAELR